MNVNSNLPLGVLKYVSFKGEESIKWKKKWLQDLVNVDDVRNT